MAKATKFFFTVVSLSALSKLGCWSKSKDNSTI